MKISRGCVKFFKIFSYIKEMTIAVRIMLDADYILKGERRVVLLDKANEEKFDKECWTIKYPKGWLRGMPKDKFYVANKRYMAGG